MSAFVAWNDLLLSHFFNPAVAGEEVFLLVTTQDLDSFGMRLGGEEGLSGWSLGANVRSG